MAEANLAKWRVDFINPDSINEDGLLITMHNADQVAESLMLGRWTGCLSFMAN